MMHSPAVAPFSHDGGSTGILFCHGFTGSPASMRPWAEHMAGLGYSVRLPLLPGHGTRWQDMAGTRWADWYDADARAFEDLAQRCNDVFVFGLSMGGTLTLRIAEQFGDRVAGIVLVNAQANRLPAASALAPVLHHVLPSLPAIGNDISRPGMNEYCYDRLPVRSVVELRALTRDVVANIARVRQPVLIATSTQDHLVDPRNSQWIAAHVASDDVSSIVLEHSFHVATLDHDAELLFDAARRFVERLAND